jgi:histone deacetylase complex regulatory component SIN3
MKIYKNIEDWKSELTDEKQKLFHEIKERKYGKSSDDSMMTISDRELSEITGAVRFTIPIKKS